MQFKNEFSTIARKTKQGTFKIPTNEPAKKSDKKLSKKRKVQTPKSKKSRVEIDIEDILDEPLDFKEGALASFDFSKGLDLR